ncbi:5'-3' exonuclease H3TH domain-containing protein [Patescibacteria group bacterium]
MEDKKKRFIIIDSNAVLHRAYHALPPLATKKGEVVNAIYGFLLVFFKAIKELHPDFIVATFDMAAPTFRHKEFKEYKAKRPKAPDEFYLQIPKVKEVLKSFNVPIFEKEGYEADDLIGAISVQAAKKQAYPKVETIILSGDLDNLQLVNSNTKVYTLRKGVKDTILYDEEKVKERYQGLVPSQLTDYRGLKGDPSDNIPGVTGIGEKTAIELLKEFKTLENLYKELDDQSSSVAKLKARTRELLLQYREQAFFSKMLATIRIDAPIDIDLKKCEWGKYDKKEVESLLQNLEFYSLINRLPE